MNRPLCVGLPDRTASCAPFGNIGGAGVHFRSDGPVKETALSVGVVVLAGVWPVEVWPVGVDPVGDGPVRLGLICARAGAIPQSISARVARIVRIKCLTGFSQPSVLIY